MYRYVEIQLDSMNDDVIKILRYSDNLVDLKTMDNNAYYVDLFGVVINTYNDFRVMILDLQFNFNKIQSYNGVSVNQENIIKTYNELSNSYKKYIRTKKLKIINEINP